MRALGIDLGSKRIGVAVSDPRGVLALPYDTVERSGDRPRDRRRLLDLAAEVEAECIVVGLPLSLDGSLGPAARAALDEVDALAALTALPIETYDERLTTVTAERSLRELNLKGEARRKVIDMAAAAVMLQAWLDGRSRPRPDWPEPSGPAPGEAVPTNDDAPTMRETTSAPARSRRPRTRRPRS